MTLAHFTLGPKARAEEGYSRGHIMKVQIALRHSRGWFYLRHPQSTPKKKGQERYRNSFGEKPNTSTLMEKGPLDNMATKDKGKAAITTIKYSAPDKAILFSFYNHPQPLWVWADGTSINLGKLNLHVDVGGRVKANIKREVSNKKKRGWEKRPRTRASQAMPRRKTSRANMLHFCMSTMTNHRSVTKA